MALFRRPKAVAADPVGVDPVVAEPVGYDTVGNPIVDRSGGTRSGEARSGGARPRDARHAAPDAGPTRAELRMLQLVADGRVVRTVAAKASAEFWRLDGAFATGTKAMMLDWLLAEGFIELGERVRVSAAVRLSERGGGLLGALR